MMLHLSSIYKDTPWCSVGDFNVVANIEEKKGDVPYNMKRSLEFIAMTKGFGFIDLGFSGQKFTCYNTRGPLFRIWKRLDRSMVNHKWHEIMPLTTITHLSSVGSDHYPLLMEMSTRADKVIKYFRFLNF